jgi:hypothetical protein
VHLNRHHLRCRGSYQPGIQACSATAGLVATCDYGDVRGERDAPGGSGASLNRTPAAHSPGNKSLGKVLDSNQSNIAGSKGRGFRTSATQGIPICFAPQAR